jgi:hypothetical protein
MLDNERTSVLLLSEDTRRPGAAADLGGSPDLTSVLR